LPTMNLPTSLSPAEIEIHAARMARLDGSYRDLAEEKKAMTRTYTNRLRQLDEERRHAAHAIRTGQIIRLVEIEHRRNNRTNEIETVRLDTNQVIERREMTPQERQLTLLEDALAGAPAPAAPPTPPPAPPAPAARPPRSPRTNPILLAASDALPAGPPAGIDPRNGQPDGVAVTEPAAEAAALPAPSRPSTRRDMVEALLSELSDDASFNRRYLNLEIDGDAGAVPTAGELQQAFAPAPREEARPSTPPAAPPLLKRCVAAGFRAARRRRRLRADPGHGYHGRRTEDR
jgi:hypothetical protein